MTILDYYNYNIISQYAGQFAEGMGNTLYAALIALVLSLVFGTLLACLSLASLPVVGRMIAIYGNIIRATPLLVQIYLVYYILPVLIPTTLSWPEINLGIAALTLCSTPFMAEIIRTGIVAIPRGQSEAAKALGMGYVLQMRHIVLPQAFRMMLPPLLGQTAILIKDTSLLSIITVFELTSAGLLLNTERVRPNESFLTIAAGYLAIYLIVVLLAHLAQNRSILALKPLRGT